MHLSRHAGTPQKEKKKKKKKFPQTLPNLVYLSYQASIAAAAAWPDKAKRTVGGWAIKRQTLKQKERKTEREEKKKRGRDIKYEKAKAKINYDTTGGREGE